MQKKEPKKQESIEKESCNGTQGKGRCHRNRLNHQDYFFNFYFKTTNLCAC